MIDLSLYSGKNIALLGLGISGIACGQCLVQSGVNVFAWDDNENSRTLATDKNIPVYDLNTVNFSNIDFLLISPGIGDEHPIAQLAIKNSVPLIGEVKLLADSLPNNTYIGITGTNGKSTTTALLSHLLDLANIDHAVGGNLGVPATALPPLDNGVYILEMSSYMLERLHGMHFNIGVFLNLSTDHLQRHKTMDEYLNAKSHLFDNMTANDTAIIAIDDVYSLQMLDKTGKANVIQVSQTNEDNDYPYLSGIHNRQNIACIRAVAKALNIADNIIENALNTFTGLAHRQQFIGTINGIDFINDSKATNAESSAKAMATYQHIYWIAGGQEKGEYNELVPHLSNIKKAYLIGKGAKNIQAFLNFNSVECEICGTMDIAVAHAFADAVKDKSTQTIVMEESTKATHTPNKTILLSPACASWDQYDSFEHRGDDFKQYVNTTIKQNT